MWKAWPYGSTILNIVFRSFHYDLLGAYNLQLRFVLLFKEIEMHSHLQTEGFFYMHHWQRFALAIFFICFVHRQQIPNGKMSLVKVKGTPAPSISKYHQGAFEQRTHSQPERTVVVLVQECRQINMKHPSAKIQMGEALNWSTCW